MCYLEVKNAPKRASSWDICGLLVLAKVYDLSNWQGIANLSLPLETWMGLLNLLFVVIINIIYIYYD